MSVSSNDNNHQQDFNFSDFIEKCRRKWWWFAIAFVCFSAIGAYMFLKNVPTFDVNASILIYTESPNSGTISLARQFSLGNMLGGSGDVNNELLVLQSHNVMAETARELKLNIGYKVKDGLKEIDCYAATTPLELVCNPAIADTIGVGIDFYVKCNKAGKADIKIEIRDYKKVIKNVNLPAVIDTDYGTFTVNPTDRFVKGESLKEKISFRSYDAAAESYLKRVGMVIPNRKSDLISLHYATQDPKFGIKLLDTIVYYYNQKGILARQERDQKTAEFIDGRLLSLTDELAMSEEDIEQFQKDKNLIDLGSEAQSILIKLTTLEANIEQAETELSLLKQTRDFLKNADNSHSLIPAGLSGSSIKDIAQAYNNLIMQRMQLTNTAKDGNKVLQTLDDKIDITRSNILLSIDKTIDNSTFRLNEMKTLNNQYEAKLNQFPSEQRLFRTIQRQQSVKEQLYLFLLQQREETALRMANAQPRATIVDEAYSAVDVHVISPKRLLVIILFLTFAFPIGILFLKEKFRNRIDSRKEAEALSTLPLLGEVSQAKGSNLVVNDSDNFMAAEQFRMMRSNIQFILSGKNEKVITVSSTRPGEGKTFISVNLAAVLSVPSSKVLLIGADIRRPKLDEYFKEDSAFGLTQYLSNESLTLSDIVNRNLVSGANVDVIFAGPVPPNPAELLLSPRLDLLVSEAREKYDFIVIDSAPMAGVSDTISIARVSDALIYVCRTDVTLKRDFEFINRLAEDERLKKISIVVNGTTPRKDMEYSYVARKK